jgi:uncharacterized membrane protein
MLTLTAFAVGCGKESEPGGPGAKTTTTPNGGSKTYAEGKAGENTFTLKVPATDVNLTQGEEKTITLTVDRGKDFKQKVAVTVEPPQGVTVTPASHEVPAGEKEFKVRVTAASKAPLGKADMRVTATPETGKAVSEMVKVDVQEGDPNAPPKTPTDAPPPN